VVVGGWVGGSSGGASLVPVSATRCTSRSAAAGARMLSILVCVGVSQQHTQTTPYCVSLVVLLFVVQRDAAVARILVGCQFTAVQV
jgi:hypothetical protein